MRPSGSTLPSPPILAAAALLLAATALSVFLALDLRRFIAGMPTLTSVSGVIAFRRVVARQMYGALGVLLLAGSATLVAAAGLNLRVASWREVPVLLAAVVLFAGIGVWCRLVERRAKRIPVIDDDIGQQRDRIVRIWATRPLPTWSDRAPA